MTIQQYRNKYPFEKALDILKPKRKDNSLKVWHVPYRSWSVDLFKDLQRIEKGLKPKLYLVNGFLKKK
jgi:hypothetical protein